MCQLLLSCIGYVPTPNVHSDVCDYVESYTIDMLLACKLKITFTFSLKLIISFLVKLQHLLLPSPIVTSSQVRVSMPLPLWSCCISGLGPEGLWQYHFVLIRTLTLNVSTITTGCFQVTKVMSVNDRAKVWEIKKIDERFVISHQHKKIML
jgi:hypothetical protein